MALAALRVVPTAALAALRVVKLRAVELGLVELGPSAIALGGGSSASDAPHAVAARSSRAGKRVLAALC